MQPHPEPRMETTGAVIGSRVLASVIDFTAIGMVFAGIVLIGNVVGEAVTLLLMVVWTGGSIVYLFLLEGLYGYTPGKLLCGLVVVNADGSACTPRDSIKRNLLWGIDGLGGAMVALVLILLTDHGQRLGDLLAETVVVKQQ